VAPIGNKRFCNVSGFAAKQSVDAPNPSVVMNLLAERKWQCALQQTGAECHRAPVKFSNQHIRPKPRSELASLGIKRISNLHAFFIDEYGIACH
jgi:hypothetical protein